MQNNHIYVFDNTISDDLCNRLISLFSNSDIIKGEENYKLGGNVLSTTIDDIPSSIDNEIFNVVIKIAHHLNRNNGFLELSYDTGYCIRKIYGQTRLHTDNLVGSSEDLKRGVIKIKDARKLSLIIALNSDYEGGELCFPDQDFKIKLKRGQAIAFPVYFTHPHYTNELYNNTFRYTINTWFS
jgi:predicted 2-oxoglutarate/Fe(II)-dependent dioxygenase YbiX